MRKTIQQGIQGNRAVGYIRVSDGSQVDGHSLDAQRKEIEVWCQHHGSDLIGTYVEAGVTAHTDRIQKRPELLRLLGDAEQHKFDLVIVHTLDRWARKLSIQMEALTRLGTAKVGFASVRDPFDASTPQGRLMLNLMGGYNEFFSELLGIHVSKAFRHKAELGLTVGPVPFGYRAQGKGLPTVPDWREADAVREIFHQRADGRTTGEIAAWLNGRGFRTKKGHGFTPHAAKDLLGCKFFLGVVVYHEEELPGQHEAIISQELFDRVQGRRQRRERMRSVHGPRGLLQGMVACARCGNRLQSDRHRHTVPLYRERHAHDCETNERSLLADGIDRQIATVIHSLGLAPDWKRRMAELAVQEHAGPSVQQLQDRLRRISRLYEDQRLDDEEYRRKTAEIDRELRQASVTTQPAIEEAAALFDDLPQLWSEATPEERRKLIAPLIERVYVDLEAKLVVGVTPAPGFGALLASAIAVAPNAPVEVISQEQLKGLENQGGWSWWRWGRPDLSQLQPTPEWPRPASSILAPARRSDQTAFAIAWGWAA